MTVFHSALTGVELHEPKGIDSANVDQLYVSDGVGSGAWTDILDALTGSGLYSTGSWTPVLTFQTPGDLSVVYSQQNGAYAKIANLVVAAFRVVTSTFTHTTASGNLLIHDLPFEVNTANYFMGPVRWQGVTKANYTSIVASPQINSTQITFPASGSAQTTESLDEGDLPTAGTVNLQGTCIYLTND